VTSSTDDVRLTPRLRPNDDSEFELYYDRRSVGQSVLVSSPHLGLMTRFLLLSDNCGFVDMGRPLWREDGSVFYNCCCLHQRSHSQVRVLWGTWPHFTVLYLRLPQPAGPGPCIYIPQEQGGPVITCPPFIPRCEPNVEHYLQQLALFRVYPLLCKCVLISVTTKALPSEPCASKPLPISCHMRHSILVKLKVLLCSSLGLSTTILSKLMNHCIKSMSSLLNFTLLFLWEY
jgi:hypothetical protein